MAKTLKALVFHNIEEVELLIMSVHKADILQGEPTNHLLDCLYEVREMFLKEEEKNDK